MVGIPSLKKKKKSDEKSKETEDIPEELPSLAEESESATEENTGKVDVDEAPVELPSVDESSEEQTEDSDAPKELPSLEEPSADSGPAKLDKDTGKLSELTDQLKEALSSEDQKRATSAQIDKRGYFSNIKEIISEPGTKRELLLKQNLFSRMKDNWEVQKKSLADDVLGFSEDSIEDDVKVRLEELSKLETKWILQKKLMEEENKLLKQREEDIKGKLDSFKQSLAEMQIHQKVKPEKFLVLNNGAVVKSISDLIGNLKIINKRTYSGHVGNEKNDIADWLSSLDSVLAEKARKAISKEDLLSILEKEHHD